MQTSGEDKFNAFACSGRRCSRRSEPEVAPADKRRAIHTSYIIHYYSHLTPTRAEPEPPRPSPAKPRRRT